MNIFSSQLKTIEITGNFLQAYEDYLYSSSEVKKALAVSGVNVYMRTFRALFYAMREKYNDEERGDIIIPNNPFKKHKITAAPLTEKRALEISQIKKIRDVKLTGKREVLAQDIFMLSLYLVGMNSVDIYNLEQINDGRITYNRTKNKFT